MTPSIKETPADFADCGATTSAVGYRAVRTGSWTMLVPYQLLPGRRRQSRHLCQVSVKLPALSSEVYRWQLAQSLPIMTFPPETLLQQLLMWRDLSQGSGLRLRHLEY